MIVDDKAIVKLYNDLVALESETKRQLEAYKNAYFNQSVRTSQFGEMIPHDYSLALEHIEDAAMRVNKIIQYAIGRSACVDTSRSKACEAFKIWSNQQVPSSKKPTVIDISCPKCKRPSPHELTGDLRSRCIGCGFAWL